MIYAKFSAAAALAFLEAIHTVSFSPAPPHDACISPASRIDGTSLCGLFDSWIRGGSGNENINEQWEAQQEVLKLRRANQDYCKQYFKKVSFFRSPHLSPHAPQLPAVARPWSVIDDIEGDGWWWCVWSLIAVVVTTVHSAPYQSEAKDHLFVISYLQHTPPSFPSLVIPYVD